MNFVVKCIEMEHILSEVTQSQKDKCHLVYYLFLLVQNLQSWVYNLSKDKSIEKYITQGNRKSLQDSDRSPGHCRAESFTKMLQQFHWVLQPLESQTSGHCRQLFIKRLIFTKPLYFLIQVILLICLGKLWLIQKICSLYFKFNSYV